MIAGKLVVETFNYGVADAEFPLFTENGKPMYDGETGNQKTDAYKLLVFEVLPGLEIEIRIREEQWQSFVDDLAERKVRVATLADIKTAAHDG